MADLQYKKLPPASRLAQVNARLTNLEQQHYDARLDLIVARRPEQIEQAKERADRHEADILELRQEEEAVNAELNPPAQGSKK